MRKFELSSRQIITWLVINYALFLLAFFTLGFLSNVKTAVVLNFALDTAICAVSLALNALLFAPRHKTPLTGKIGLLFATLCLAAFTCYAFLLPESGMPPVLFS